MLTRCSACATTFRVTPEQLKARLGRVRCGSCQTVFNALDSLIEETAQSTAESLPDTPLTPLAVPVEMPEPATLAPVSEAPLSEEVDTIPSLAPEDAPDIPDILLESSFVSTVEAADSAAEEAPAPLADPVVIDPPLPTFDPLPEILPAKPLRWPWITGLVLGLMLLVLQAVLHFRVELSVLVPELKPALIAACQPFACSVPLPAHADLLIIESSDLHPGEHKGQLQLTATLKNRAPFPQSYPLLELTLNDIADRPLIVRSLRPEEYLPPTRALAAGFAAQSDLALSLDLDVGDTPAAGYRLYIYYP